MSKSSSPSEVSSQIHNELRSKSNNVKNEGEAIITQESLLASQRIDSVKQAAHSKFNDIDEKGKLADSKISEAQKLQNEASDKLFQAKAIAAEAPSHISQQTKTITQDTYDDSKHHGGMMEGLKDAFFGIKNDIASVFSSSSSSSSSTPSASSSSSALSSTTSSSSSLSSSPSKQSHTIAEGIAFPFNRANELPSSSLSSSSSTSTRLHDAEKKMEQKMEHAYEKASSSAHEARERISAAEKRAEVNISKASKTAEEKAQDLVGGIRGALASVFSSSSSTSTSSSTSSLSSSPSNTSVLSSSKPLSDGLEFPYNRAGVNSDNNNDEVYKPEFVRPPSKVIEQYMPLESRIREPLFEQKDLDSPSTLHALHTSTGELANLSLLSSSSSSMSSSSSSSSMMSDIKQKLHDIKDTFAADSMMNDRAKFVDDEKPPTSA